MRMSSPLSSRKRKTTWWSLFWGTGNRYANSLWALLSLSLQVCSRLRSTPLQTKATTVIQMFHANPNKTQWTKFSTGVVCFVKDNIQRSYYIRLLDLWVSSLEGAGLVRWTAFHAMTLGQQQLKKVTYEQEIYDQFTYKKHSPCFHSFPGDVSWGEAGALYMHVNIHVAVVCPRFTLRLSSLCHTHALCRNSWLGWTLLIKTKLCCLARPLTPRLLAAETVKCMMTRRYVKELKIFHCYECQVKEYGPFRWYLNGRDGANRRTVP